MWLVALLVMIAPLAAQPQDEAIELSRRQTEAAEKALQLAERSAVAAEGAIAPALRAAKAAEDALAIAERSAKAAELSARYALPTVLVSFLGTLAVLATVLLNLRTIRLMAQQQERESEHLKRSYRAHLKVEGVAISHYAGLGYLLAMTVRNDGNATALATKCRAVARFTSLANFHMDVEPVAVAEDGFQLGVIQPSATVISNVPCTYHETVIVTHPSYGDLMRCYISTTIEYSDDLNAKHSLSFIVSFSHDPKNFDFFDREGQEYTVKEVTPPSVLTST